MLSSVTGNVCEDAGMGRSYRIGSQLPFIEDKHHEFKGHTNLCVEDLPKWAYIKGTMRRSRRAISRTLNAFLNSNVEATVYLGITDAGIVKGIPFSVDQTYDFEKVRVCPLNSQKFHMELALEDLMKRYTPSVPRYRFKIEYVPALEDAAVPRCKSPPTTTPAAAAGNGESSSASSLSSPDSPSQSGHEGAVLPRLYPPEWSQLQRSSHKLRSPNQCWCEQATRWMRQNNIQVPHYVIEIHVYPFLPRSDVDPVVLQLHPIHQDEEERAYFRGAASVYSLTHQDVAELTRRQVQDHFEDVRRRMNSRP